LEERAEQIRSKSYLIQMEREKMQMELSHKRARVELERAANTSARNYETISSLKGRVSEMQLNAMDQKVQVKRLESEKQELKEQLELQQRKCQEASQKIQELQASQEERADHEQKIKKLLAKLQSWEKLDQTMGVNLRTPEDLSRFVVELQQRELTLKEKNNTITSSARGLEKAQQQLQDEVRQVSAQLLEERKKREIHEALARRLQKRIVLLTKERDGMRAILGSYDSELTQAEYSAQLTQRMWEAEDMVQKVHAHSSEMETQLSQALEELGVQKQRADTLEMELKMLRAQTSSAETSFPFCKEEVDALRLKVEELEVFFLLIILLMARSPQASSSLTRGDYNQSRTKVLHMSLNPASMARKRQQEDHARLQGECERLRGLVHALERGGPIPADLEVASSLPSSKEVAELRKQVESAELKNQRLKEVFQTKIQEFRKVCYTLTGYQIDVTTENQYRLTSRYAEHQSDCLIFKKQELASISMPSMIYILEAEFHRKKIVLFIRTEPTRRMERAGEEAASFCTPAPTVQGCQRLQVCSQEEATGPSGSKMQLLETEFSRSVPELIELHLLQQDSIPAFLSALTIELFSRQTSI
ncbi:mitotic spindle assembly checkpoint protein MAD1, partial [Cricetulus griseus]